MDSLKQKKGMPPPLPPGMGESNSKANLKARMDAMKMLNIDESGERKGALPLMFRRYIRVLTT